jgi:hypothetical protein
MGICTVFQTIRMERVCFGYGGDGSGLWMSVLAEPAVFSAVTTPDPPAMNLPAPTIRQPLHTIGSYNNFSGRGMVPVFAQVDSLPGTHIQFAAGDGYTNRGA